jgi:hypothetical protein
LTAELKEAAIGWNWYQRDEKDEWTEPKELPTPPPGTEGIWQRSVSWIDPSQVTAPN